MDEPPSRRERILLIRLSAIGDVVHALFGLAALRAARPGARIGFLVEDRAASLLADHPQVDRVHVYPRKRWQEGIRRDPGTVIREARDFLAGLRGERYGVAVDLQGNLKSGVLAVLSGTPRRIGLARGSGKEGNHLFHTERVRPPAGPLHRVDRALALLAPLGVEGEAGVPRVAVSAEDREDVDRFLEERGLAAGGFAVMHPGTSRFGLHKRWPPDRFGRAAAALRQRAGLPTVATWGPGERPLAEEVVRASGGAAVAGPRTRRLTALARLADRAALFVAADTGALHLAALGGTPTLGLFGPKDPRVYAPRGPRTAVVVGRADCSPCRRRSCPDPICMTSISVDDVVRAALGLLDGAVPSGVPGKGGDGG